MSHLIFVGGLEDEVLFRRCSILHAAKSGANESHFSC